MSKFEKNELPEGITKITGSKILFNAPSKALEAAKAVVVAGVTHDESGNNHNVPRISASEIKLG
jgi:hypothetical protein